MLISDLTYGVGILVGDHGFFLRGPTQRLLYRDFILYCSELLQKIQTK